MTSTIHHLLQVLLLILFVGGCRPAGGQTTLRLVDGKPQKTRFIPAAAYEHYLQARVALGRGQLKAAASLLRQALILDPRSPHLHTELATVLLQLGRVKQARQRLDRALELQPRFPDALVLQGQLLRRKDRLPAAERTFRRCIRENPAHAAAYLNLAEMLEAADRPGAATTVLLQMVKGVAGKARLEGHRRLALLCLRQVSYHCAARHFRLALQGETNLNVLLRLAHVHRALDQPRQATRLLREAFDRSDTNHRVAANLLDLLRHTGSRQEVVDLLGVLRAAAGGHPDRLRVVAELALDVGQTAWALALLDQLAPKDRHAALEVTRGVALYRTGRRAEGQALLTGLLGGEAGASAALRLARLLGQQGAHGAAARLLRQALTRHGNSTKLVLLLSRALNNDGRSAESVRVVRDALLARPDDRTLRFGLAAALERTGDWRTALRQIRKILDRHPKDAPALNFLGYTLADHGEQLDRAERVIRRALFLDPGEGYIIDSLGWLCFRRGERARARQLLEMAARLAPGEAEILSHLAEVEVELKQTARAIQLLRRAISASDDQRLTARLRRVLKRLEKGRVGTR